MRHRITNVTIIFIRTAQFSEQVMPTRTTTRDVAVSRWRAVSVAKSPKASPMEDSPIEGSSRARGSSTLVSARQSTVSDLAA